MRSKSVTLWVPPAFRFHIISVSLPIKRVGQTKQPNFWFATDMVFRKSGQFTYNFTARLMENPRLTASHTPRVASMILGQPFDPARKPRKPQVATPGFVAFGCKVSPFTTLRQGSGVCVGVRKLMHAGRCNAAAHRASKQEVPGALPKGQRCHE